MPWTENCAVCGKPLPLRGNRRLPIPALHGQKRKVHAACAEQVERQQTLDLKQAS